MSTEAVRKNYSPVGASLIEKLYSDDYLSIGGTQSTDILADQAGITAESRVLDVGSGLGGPALHLAATRGCRITGLDLVETSILEANNRAKARGLEGLATFQAGDATDMPFESGTFDVVWGQDAWCHVPDKPKLIAECARVLAPKGTIVFTDWLQTGEMDEAQREAVHDATASSNMATMECYCELLEKSGFSVLGREDISAAFITQYRTIIARLERLESEISEQFNPKVFRIMMEKNGAILHAFEGGLIGGGRLVAKRG
ncbi:MAG: methyltransferase domain-containing protein [Alphaproteobacteria bacterium]|nr:methyltransferase domain-containing protein [Alphaproteobacteria bacterium]